MPSFISKLIRRDPEARSPRQMPSASSSTASLVSVASSQPAKSEGHATFFDALEREAVAARDAKLGAGLSQLGW
jgi:hypothetical protein